MASNSLKIVNTDGSINEGGYIAVVKNIVLDPDGMDDFVGEDDDARFTKARTRKLRRWATSDNGLLQQLDEEDAPKDVTPQNCRIRAQFDARKESARGFSKVTISLPETSLTTADLDYIDRYVLKYLQIRTGASGTTLPGAASADTERKARMFMFGVFMLTKCR
jgi:hypothetical protein